MGQLGFGLLGWPLVDGAGLGPWDDGSWAGVGAGLHEAESTAGMGLRLGLDRQWRGKEERGDTRGEG